MHKVLWNHAKKFKNSIIHPGYFHFMKENFQVMGNFVSSSSFEGVVFQAGLCPSGSLLGVLSGSHYNRAWTVHSTMAEELERLLLALFIGDVSLEIPIILHEVSADILPKEIVVACKALVNKYEVFKQCARKGDLGGYLDLIGNQHQGLHSC